MWKRLVPHRWARITSWTLAAVAWATTALVAQNSTVAVANAVPAAPEPAVAPDVVSVPAPLPAAPADGLVVLRYTPVPPPPPQEIVRTVVVNRTAQASGPARVASSGS